METTVGKLPRNQIHKKTAEPQGKGWRTSKTKRGVTAESWEHHWEELQTVEQGKNPESAHQQGFEPETVEPPRGRNAGQS